jgi:hypothetical protein
MTRTIDFDAFRAEQKREPVELLVGGKTYQLPPTLPAALALDVVRLNEELGAGAEARTEDLLNVGAALFGGEDGFKAVLTESGIGLDELPDLIQMVVEVYTADPADPTPAQA